MASENRHHTCFQRTRDKPNLPPWLRRRMNKPTSMIRSKTRLEIIVGIKLITLDLVLTGSHVRCAGSETARSYGSDEPSESKVQNNWSSTRAAPVHRTEIEQNSRTFTARVKRGSLLMWNAALIIHTVIVSVVTTLFLFQIAMLAVSMST